MTEKIEVVCPKCQRLLKVPSNAAGKRGRCPRCQNEFTIEPVVMLDPSTEVVASHTAGPPDGPLSQSPDPFGFNDPLGGTSWPAAPAAPAATNPFPYSPASATPPPAMSAWNPAASSPSSSVGSDYLQNAQQDLASQHSRKRHEAIHGSGGGTSAGIVGGIIAMVVAVVWFVAGLFANRIFFYPPVMFVFGMIAVIKGVLNLSDDR